MSELLSFEVEDKVYNRVPEYVNNFTFNSTICYLSLLCTLLAPSLARINSRTKTFIINLNVHVQLEF